MIIALSVLFEERKDLMKQIRVIKLLHKKNFHETECSYTDIMLTNAEKNHPQQRCYRKMRD
jgi:hypothetical protein